MKSDSSKKVLKNSVELSDLLSMQTEVAFLESMSQSKTLTAIVIAGVTTYINFMYWVVKMASSL